ncbi:MAG: hypothetical protein GKS00_04900 [Alphaproteobacteria bacterium]|nr:hypothetical protein [Alphaproteobacteria bacterium]
MKVAELVAAFQRFTATQNNSSAAAQGALPLESTLRVRDDGAQEQTAIDTDDQISVSPEAVFTFAASLHDPQRISRNDAGVLADTLRDGGAISLRDHAILTSQPNGRDQTAVFERDPNAPTNLVTEFQGRLSFDLSHSNIGAVEEDTRALSILGRLTSIRAELS